MQGLTDVAWCRFWLWYYRHPKLALSCIVSIVILLVSVFLPAQAWASIDDVISGATEMLDNIKNPGKGMFAAAIDNLNSISVSGIAQSFSNLFSGSGAYGAVSQMANSITVYCGYSVLVIAYLIQIGKLGMKLDGNGSLPGLRDIILLLLFFTLFKHLVDNSLYYCEAVFDGFNNIIYRFSGSDSVTIEGVLDKEATVEAWIDTISNSDGGAWFTQIIYGAIILVASVAMQVAAYVSVMGRSLQVYVYAIFAPIPLACLAAEETRQWGVGYIKNFLALCLTGAIIYVVLTLFPLILTSITASSTQLFQIIAVCVLGVISLMKCGQWARDVLGG